MVLTFRGSVERPQGRRYKVTAHCVELPGVLPDSCPLSSPYHSYLQTSNDVFQWRLFLTAQIWGSWPLVVMDPIQSPKLSVAQKGLSSFSWSQDQLVWSITGRQSSEAEVEAENLFFFHNSDEWNRLSVKHMQINNPASRYDETEGRKFHLCTSQKSLKEESQRWGSYISR